LEEYSARAFGAREEAILSEVAAKLRVLVVRSRHNKPLLFEVLDRCGLAMSITLGGPPGLQRPVGSAEPMPGDVVSLDAFFDLRAITIRTSAGLVDMSKRQLIRAVAEQLGGAHEDWSVDESLRNAFASNVRFSGLKPTVMEIADSARIALTFGRMAVGEARKKMAEMSGA
jgi:hypothetical protein